MINIQQYLTVKNILLAVLAIGVVILLITLFKGKPLPDQKLVQELLAAKDSLNSAQKSIIKEKDSHIADLKEAYSSLSNKDSLLQVHYDERDILIKNLNETIRHIPERIIKISANNDSLRRLISEY